MDDFQANSSLQPDPDREKKQELIDEEGANLHQQRDYDPFYSDAFYIPVAALN